MAHDLAATRRVRKGLLSGATPSDGRAAAETPAGAQVAPTIGDRVVADVRHEIGNYFHKLYYWADFLTESRSGRSGDVTATQMLEETIHNLEDLLRALLEYVRPMAATPVHMHAREVADGVARQLASGLAGWAVTPVVDDALAADLVLLVDPGRLSQLLAAMVRRIEATVDAKPGVEVRTTRERRAPGDVLVVQVIGTGASSGHSTLAEVEWATAENVARLIGGELTTHETGGRTTIVLTLPLRS